MAARLRRPSPDPGFGSMVELDGGHLHGSLDLTGIGETLARQRIATEEAPPALLQIQPAGAFRDEDMLDARMIRKPGTSLPAVMAAQVVGDDEDVAHRVVGFDVLEEPNVVLGVTRRSTSGELLAIADAQRPVDPDLVVPATVFQWRLDAMAIR